MAPKRRTRRDEGTPPPQPAAKRQKTALDQPSVSRRNRATKEAAPNASAATSETHGSESKKKPRSNQRVRPPRKPQPKPKPKPQGLLSLPLELQEQIFLHTSAKDTARLHRVCKSLDAAIRSSTRYLATNFSRKEWKRIQSEVNDFASLKAPTDLDSLMKALHTWTKRRDTFQDREVASDSIMKLMMHCFLRDGPGKDQQAMTATYGKIIDWAELAAHIIEVCHESGGVPTEEFDIDIDFKYLSQSGLLDYNDYDKLFEHLQHPELQEESHRLGGRMWSSRALERLRFPPGRMTPLLHYPCFSRFDEDEPHDSDELTQERDTFWDYVRGEPTKPLLEATHGNLLLVRYLRLPELPNAVSCYYLNDSWSRKEVKKLLALFDATATGPVRIDPLLKAAILARVMLF